GGEEVHAVFRRRRSDVAAQHDGALRLQCPGDAAADTARAAGDQGTLALQKFRVHSDCLSPKEREGSVAMPDPQPVFDQINIVSGDVGASIAFYRRLGIAIPENDVWRMPTGAHHVSAQRATADGQATLDIDSMAFARRCNAGSPQ